MTLKDINLDKRTEKYTYPYLYRSIGWEGAKKLRKDGSVSSWIKQRQILTDKTKQKKKKKKNEITVKGATI